MDVKIEKGMYNMDKIFRYLRYYYMMFMGYTGKWLMSTNSDSFNRWSFFYTHYTRHYPQILIVSKAYNKYYWYSAKELLDNFHNSAYFNKDRQKDI